MINIYFKTIAALELEPIRSITKDVSNLHTSSKYSAVEKHLNEIEMSEIFRKYISNHFPFIYGVGERNHTTIPPGIRNNSLWEENVKWKIITEVIQYLPQKEKNILKGESLEYIIVYNIDFIITICNH